MKNSNLSLMPVIKDGDGGGDDLTPTFQLILDLAENGFVLTIAGAEEIKTKVYLFSAKGDDGPSGLIQEVINQLGIVDKVKLQK